MSVNVFELMASLALDTSKFSQSLSTATNDLNGLTGTLGTVLGAAQKVDKFLTEVSDTVMTGTASAVTATFGFAKAIDDNVMGAVDQASDVVISAFSKMASAAADFLRSAVNEGMSFDTAMGQVSATLLQSRDDFDSTKVSVNGFTGSLRDLAKELGATTKFTATQAGEALNYMALAGYDAQTSAEMLGQVLNLASAGMMDLGYASDVVTDAQTALGIEMSDMTTFVDQLAKTASSSNTSVSQLGEALLALGATGRTVNGGFTELNVVLGALANNGKKGSEGGNDLRRQITRLIAPTKEASDWFEKLNFSAYDQAGHLKALPQLYQELGSKLDKLSEKQRNTAVSDIFGQYALAGANALLNTTAEQWDNLTEKIMDAKGAAADMAKIQLETLPGQITILQSAFSGLQTEIYEKVAPTTKEFVETLSNGLSDVTKEITSGNFEAAFSRLGTVASRLIEEGVNTILENNTTINNIIDGFVTFIGKIGTALFENGSELLPNLLGHLLYFSSQLITNFSEFLGKSENLLTIERTVTQLFDQLSTFFENNRDKLYTIFSVMFDVSVQFIDDLFVLNRETIYSILYQKFTEIIDSLLQNFEKYLDGEKLASAVDSVLHFVGTVAQKLLDSMDTILPKMIELATMIGNKVIDGLSNFISDPENAKKVQDMFNTLINSVTQFYYKNENKLREILDPLYENFIRVMVRISIIKKDWTIGTIWAVFKGALEGIYESLYKWLEGLDLHEKLKKVALAALDFNPLEILNNFVKDKLKRIGEMIVGGILSGFLGEQNEWLWNILPQSAKDLIDAFNQAYDIRSPSKLTEKVGNFLAKGIGVGFSKEMDNISKTMINAVPTDFDVQAKVTSTNAPVSQWKSFELHIDRFYNNTTEDINSIADRMSYMLRNQIYSEKSAVI